MWDAQPGASGRQLGVHSTFEATRRRGRSGGGPSGAWPMATSRLPFEILRQLALPSTEFPLLSSGGWPSQQPARGYTLIEMMFVMVLSLTLGAVATPQLLAAV